MTTILLRFAKMMKLISSKEMKDQKMVEHLIMTH